MSFLGKAFGTNTKGPAKVDYNTPGFNGGGLVGQFDGTNYNVSPTLGRDSAVGDVADAFRAFGDETGALRSTVAPGFNSLLAARLNDLNDMSRSAIGNLRENLSARRVLGSSFGQDTLTRANAEFSKQRDAVVADNFLKSLDANNKLLVQQYDAYNKQFQTKLSELNLEAGIASNLSSTTAQILAQNAQTQAKINQQDAEFNAKQNMETANGVGKFVGKVGEKFLGPSLDRAGTAFSNFLFA